MTYYILKSTDSTNSNINLKKSFRGGYQLFSFSFLNELYNVNTYNNILPYYEGSTLTNIELTQQFANGNDLATDMQTKINAISGGTASVSYSSNTGKFTITNTTSFSLKFGDNTSFSCNNLLGFTQANTTSGTSLTSSRVANLLPFHYITIKVQQDKCLSIRDQVYHYNTFIIQGKSDFSDIFIYKPLEYDSVPQSINIDPTKSLSIRFYDHNNNEITLNNWTLVLKTL